MEPSFADCDVWESDPSAMEISVWESSHSSSSSSVTVFAAASAAGGGGGGGAVRYVPRSPVKCPSRRSPCHRRWDREDPTLTRAARERQCKLHLHACVRSCDTSGT